MQILRDRLFTSVALGHLTVDILNGQRLVLLTYLALTLGLSNATLGIVSTVYLLTGALAQPVFGYLADRWGPRWLVTAGILWMGVFVSLAVISPGTFSLVFLVLSSLGSGVFHPAGAAQAALRGQKHFSGREGTSTAMFFLFGQLGYFIGPVLAGKALDTTGLQGMLLIASLTLPVAAANAWALRLTGPAQRREKQASPEGKPLHAGWSAAAVLLALAIQAMTQSNMNTFLPRYLADLGHNPTFYGFLSALFMGGAAAGNLIGGSLSDRMSKYLVIVMGLAGASLPIFLIGRINSTQWLYLLIPVAGVMTGMAYTVLIVLGQRLIPGGMGIASGLVLTLSFSSGAVGPLIAGFVADRAGLPSVFTLAGAMALMGGVVALGIGRQAGAKLPVSESLARAGD